MYRLLIEVTPMQWAIAGTVMLAALVELALAWLPLPLDPTQPDPPAVRTLDALAIAAMLAAACLTIADLVLQG